MATQADTSIEIATSGPPITEVRASVDDALRLEDSLHQDVMRVDPDLDNNLDEIDKLDPDLFPVELQSVLDFDKIKSTYQNAKSVSILITGKTGSGKSTLTNGILGMKLGGETTTAKESGAINTACTTEVTMHRAHKGKIEVTVWDSPGLQDGTRNQEEYLRQMKHQCTQRDLTLYCIRITEGRFLHGGQNPDVVAMRNLTKAFGGDFWRSTVIVLTFANTIEAFNLEWEDLPLKEKAKAFQAKIDEWEDQVRAILIKDVKLSKETVYGIRITPAGHYRKPHLPNCKFWLSNLWFNCLSTIPSPEARAALIKINTKRFKTQATSEDFRKSAENQPIVVINTTTKSSFKESSDVDTTMAVLGEIFGGRKSAIDGPGGLITVPLGAALGTFLR